MNILTIKIIHSFILKSTRRILQSQFGKKLNFNNFFKNHHELTFFNRNMQREKKSL